ncbi:MAG TPA: AAA family ATPase, partial [Bacteroidales bacterium]|nr:AAA family ATPase [Bacteroidales bacterium]
MNWITRYLEETGDFLTIGKVNLLYGPRRVGKTMLIQKLLSELNVKVFVGDGDDIELRRILGSENKTLILSVFGLYNYIFIDEAQRIPNIGWGLKILSDNLP